MTILGSATGPRTLLEQKIRERRLSFAEFAELTEDVARKNKNVGTLSFRHLQRLITGKGPNGGPLGPVRPATARLLEEIFGISVDLLLGPPERTPASAVPANLGIDPPFATPASHLSLIDLQVPQNLPSLSMFASNAPREVFGASTITTIRAMADAIQIADRKLGGGKLYLTVTRYLRSEIAPYFLDPPGDCSPSELFSAAASMTEIAGWMAHDGGNNDRARTHFANAYRLTRTGKNAALSANVCASMAHLAIQLDFPDDAETISSVGLQHVTEIDGAQGLVARLHAMRARACAVAGRETECRTNLESAHQSLTSESNDADIGWIAGFDEASLASESALCFLALGSLGQAEEESRKVIQLRVGDRVRSRALAQLTLASVLVKERHFDEAARIGMDVCKVAGELNSVRVHVGISKLGEQLALHREIPDVADFFAMQADLGQKTSSMPNEVRWPA